MRSCIVIFCSLVFFSCANDDQSVDVEVSPVLSISEFGDNFFVSDNIKSIIVSNNDYYFLDKKAGVVVRADSDFNFKSVYGKRGRGPGEVVFLESFGVGDDKIYLDGNGCSYNVFDINTGEYLETINYDEVIGGSPITSRLVIDNSAIVASYNGKYTTDGTPLVRMDLSGNQQDVLYGTVAGGNDKVKKMTDRDLFKLESGGLLSVVKNVPVIDIYDNNMKYKESIDISDTPLIKSRIDQIEKQKRKNDNPNTIYYLFKDSYYSDGRLYILCLTESENSSTNRVECNTVLEFKYSKRGLKYDRTIKLLDLWYGSICVTMDNKRLVGANTFSSSIDVFNL